MKFHSIHGGNIRLDAEKTLAVRKKGFCDGITFSHKPIKIGQCYSIRITYAKQWSGALRLGVTSHDPNGFSHDNGALGVLPKYSCPDLLSKDGFWAKPVREESTVSEGATKITFQVTSGGKMLLFVNNELKGAHLTDISNNGPLWAIIDVYGTTESAQLLPEGEAPLEVVARGPKLLEAYKRAMAGGTAALRHFRLYIVGREGVGKTSLAKSLIGQSFDPEELPTAGIECYCNYEAEVGSAGKPWSQVCVEHGKRRLSQASPVEKEDEPEGEGRETSAESPATVEEKELLHSIAKNILWEMKQGSISKKHSPSKSQDSSRSGWRFFTDDNNVNPKHPIRKAKSAVQSNNKANNNLSNKGNTFRNFVKRHQQSVAPEDKDRIRTISFMDWHQPVPEISQKLMSAIEEILAQNETNHLKEENPQGAKKNARSKKVDEKFELHDKKVTFDIWDMSGNYGYYPALLSCLVNRAIYLVVFDLTSDLDALTTPEMNGNDNAYFDSCQMVQNRRRSTSAPGNQEKRGKADEDQETLSAKSINRSKSSQAFNMSKSNSQNNGEWELTNLDYILHWLECIFVHATASAMKHDAENLTTASSPEDQPLPAVASLNANDVEAPAMPVVFIVGTRKNALNVANSADGEELIKDKFSRIKEAMRGKPYERLVRTNFIAVENNPCDLSGELDDEDASRVQEDESLVDLRQKIADAGWQIQLTTHQVPLSWLQLRARLAASANDGINFLSFEQVKEMAEDESGGIYLHPRPTTHQSFTNDDNDVDRWSALGFLHDVGSLVVCNINASSESGYAPSSPDLASMSDVGTVTPLIVLRPTWLAQILATFLHPCLPIALNRSLEIAVLDNKHLEEAERQSVWTSEFNNPSIRRGEPQEEDWETLCSRFALQWNHLERDGVLEQCLCQRLFPGESWVQESILALLAHYDILATSNGASGGAQQCGQTSCRRFFYVPCRIFFSPPPERLLQEGEEDLLYYIHFRSFFSDALFARLVTRLIQWSQDSLHVNKRPVLYFRTAILWLENGHTLILQMSPLRYSRVKVRLTRQTHLDDFGYDLNASCRSGLSMGISRNRGRPLQRENCYNGMPKPLPQICAKVRHVLESQLLQMKQSGVRRLNHKFMVRCPCDKACDLHRRRSCNDENCLHFLLLDDCLNNTVVPCDYRRIKTEPYRLWFPSSSPEQKRNPSALSLSPRQLWSMMENKGSRDQSSSKSLKNPSKFWDPPVSDRAALSIPDHMLPEWITTAARMLTGSPEGNDWAALGSQLGYRQSKLDQMEEALNPALTLLRDWVSVSGNSYFCLETLVSCLDQIHRQDVSNLIRRISILGAPTIRPPDVFISYDWEAQEEVLLIRTNLEKNGFVCWMDVGQMGGGDSLYARIYQGISQAKVFLCFLTPRYIVSQWSRREMSLADIMMKPILPVMLLRTPWPPPGPMAIVLAPLVFIDMSGMGGHGGSGRHGDWETRFREIVFQVSAHASPQQGTSLAVRPKSNAQILEVSDFGRSNKLEVGDGLPSGLSSSARMNRIVSSSSLGAGGGILRINPNLPPSPQPFFIQDEHESPLRSSAGSSTRTVRSFATRRRHCCCHPGLLQQDHCSIL